MNTPSDELIHPAMQARSRARQERIVSAGLELLSLHRFDEITMEMIAKRAGCSVGTLYKRFANKEALLVVLADMVRQNIVSELQADGLPAPGPQSSLDDVLRISIEFLTVRLRRHESLMRAMMLRQLSRSTPARPLQDAARAILKTTVERAAEFRPGCLSQEEFERRITVGFQCVVGTLLNMIINRPGPLHLQDDATPVTLAQIMHAYVVSK